MLHREWRMRERRPETVGNQHLSESSPMPYCCGEKEVFSAEPLVALDKLQTDQRGYQMNKTYDVVVIVGSLRKN